MADQPNMWISVIPFLVPRHKVWLMPTAGVPCSNTASIRERKSPWKCIYGVPAQEMAKHHAKFCWPSVSDVASVTKPVHETKVRTDSSTEFGSNRILIDRIQIESAAGSNPILIVEIRTALDRMVNFNERITTFTIGRACTPSSDIKGGCCLVLGTASIRSADAADASCARWLADHVVVRCPINGAGCIRMWLIDSWKQPMSAADSGVACSTPFVQCITLSFANGRIFSDGPWKVTVGIRLVQNCQFWGGRFY